ncbi:MAG: DUF4131 domain-containing protein, partial [Magnetospirillum sp.]|nr:DUF4131 domain-containing protein [Magnetospirillum sp.]
MAIFLPNRIGFSLIQRLGFRNRVFCLSGVLAPVMAERDRWPLWLPVFFSFGISLYFALPSEPQLWGGGLALVGCALAAWLARRHGAALLPLLALLCMCLGFFAAEMRSAIVAAPVLERPSGSVRVEGRVEEVEPLAGGGQRVTLTELAVELEGARPERVRLKLKSNAEIRVGSRIAIAAVLMPPPQPAAPGAFDFARFAWFMGLGAIGTGNGEPELLAEQDNADGVASVMLMLNHLRHHITVRIIEVLPADGTGAVAAALVAGEMASI